MIASLPLLAGLLGALAPPSCASRDAPCACADAPPSVDDARHQSDHVVLASVVRREAVHGTLDDSVRAPGARQWSAQLVTLAVERGYWGLRADTIRLIVRSPCDADLVAAEGMVASPPGEAGRAPLFLVYAI